MFDHPNGQARPGANTGLAALQTTSNMPSDGHQVLVLMIVSGDVVMPCQKLRDG
jgi:hypothetical protein